MLARLMSSEGLGTLANNTLQDNTRDASKDNVSESNDSERGGSTTRDAKVLSNRHGDTAGSNRDHQNHGNLLSGAPTAHDDGDEEISLEIPLGVKIDKYY